MIISIDEKNERAMGDNKELIDAINATYKKCGIDKTVAGFAYDDAWHARSDMPSFFKPTEIVYSSSSETVPIKRNEQRVKP